MKKRDRDYDLTKDLISLSRGLNGTLLNEAEDDSKNEEEDIIPITNDVRFGNNVLKNQIDAFKKSVHPGAKFASENNEDAESNPLVYYPKSGNLIFSGSIPCLSDMKFQFSLNDVTSAPYIFVDGLALTDEVITTLNKLHGHYLNWREQFLSATDLLEKLKKDYDKED